MSKHRTKAQKLKVANKKTELTSMNLPTGNARQSEQISTGITWQPGSAKIPAPSPASTTSKTKESGFIWRFNPSLIYRDLLKTGLASLLIVGILLLIYYLSFVK